MPVSSLALWCKKRETARTYKQSTEPFIQLHVLRRSRLTAYFSLSFGILLFFGLDHSLKSWCTYKRQQWSEMLLQRFVFVQWLQQTKKRRTHWWPDLSPRLAHLPPALSSPSWCWWFSWLVQRKEAFSIEASLLELMCASSILLLKVAAFRSKRTSPRFYFRSGITGTICLSTY